MVYSAAAPVAVAEAPQQPVYNYAPPMAQQAPVAAESSPAAPALEQPATQVPAPAPQPTTQAPPTATQLPIGPAVAPPAAQPTAPTVVEQPAVGQPAPAVPSEGVTPAQNTPPDAAKPADAAPTNNAEPTQTDQPSETFIKAMNDGAAAFATGDYDKARHAFVLAILNSTDRPENIDAKLAYAVTQFALGDYHVAAMLMRQVIPENPLTVYAPFDLRERYDKKERLAKETEALQTYVKTHPADVDAMVVLGFVLHFTGQRDQARQVFADVVKIAPKDSLAAVFLNPPPPPTTQPTSQAPATQPASVVPGPTAAPTTRPAMPMLEDI